MSDWLALFITWADSLRYPIGVTSITILALVCFRPPLNFAGAGLWLLAAAALAIVPPRLPLPDEPQKGIRLAFLNTKMQSRNYTDRRAFVANSHADIVLLLEAHPAWRDFEYPHLQQQYPFMDYAKMGTQRKTLKAYEDRFMLLSKFPVINKERFLNQSLLYEIQHPEKPFYLLALHPLAPVSPKFLQERNESLQALAKLDLPQDKPLVIAGDFNTVSWQQPLKAFNKQNAVGKWPTFPSILPLVPIDHILLPHSATVHYSRPVYVNGSDHLAVLADFSF